MSSHRMTWRTTIRVRVRRALTALTTLPYRPGEIDPRPIIGGDPAVPKPRPEPPRLHGAHAAGSRSDLRPVRDLLPVDPAVAAASTVPIPLAEIALLSHTGVEELLAEAHAINHPEPAPVISVRARAAWQVDLISPLPTRPTPGWSGLARFRRKELL